MKFSKFFSGLQEAPWYREFLNPVMDEISHNSRLLDIGTGSGKMLEILFNEKNVKCVGTDTDQGMLDEAKKKLKSTNAELHLTLPGDALSFEENSFDHIAICSVLFHLKKEEIDAMLKDVLRLLKVDGTLIILTPTGEGNLLKLTKHFFSLKNRTIYVWYRATKKRARKWTTENYLSEYATSHQLNYMREIVMHGFAQLEVITKAKADIKNQ